MDWITADNDPHDILRTPANPVTFPLSRSVRKIIAEMEHFIETVIQPQGGMSGMAAPQVGHPLQIIFLEVSQRAVEYRKDATEVVPLTMLLNPSYQPLPEAELVLDWEGCFSVPGYMGEVPRHNAISYQYHTREGEWIQGIARGFFARVLQHEIGHLNGELYPDLIPIDGRFGELELMRAVRDSA